MEDLDIIICTDGRAVIIDGTQCAHVEILYWTPQQWINAVMETQQRHFDELRKRRKPLRKKK